MRIAVLSRRTTSGPTTEFPAFGVWTEAEDVLIQAVAADVVQLPHPIQRPSVRLRRQTGRLARRAFGSQVAVPALPGGSAVNGLTGRYDLVVFLAYSIWDLPLVERLGDLRKYSDNIVVWFLESWPSAYQDGRVAMEPFHTVDHIFVGLDVAVEPLSQAIGRQVRYLPMATDVLRFGPTELDLPRPIDMFVPGRRDATQHNAMLQWAAAHERLYLYDTTNVGMPVDLQTHRDALGERYSKTKLSVCNYAKKGERAVIGPNRAMPGRLWEAFAAGCAIVGEPPSIESQRAVFGTELVTALPDGPEDYVTFLEDMIANRQSADIANQVTAALAGHDWAHRWREMFSQLDLSIPVGLQNRIDALAQQSARLTG